MWLIPSYWSTEIRVSGASKFSGSPSGWVKILNYDLTTIQSGMWSLLASSGVRKIPIPVSGKASINTIISSPLRPDKKQIRGSDLATCGRKYTGYMHTNMNTSWNLTSFIIWDDPSFYKNLKHCLLWEVLASDQ